MQTMKITPETVDRIAELSKLEFNAEEKASIMKDLDRILSFVEQLNEVDTDGVEPLIYMSEEVNVLRKDETRQDITRAEALKNAPQHDSDYFKVPKVIGGSPISPEGA